MKYARWVILAGMAAFLALTVLAFTSCQLATHEAHASATKWERDTNITWGGTTHTTGADGWDNSTDHNASFQVGAQSALALGTGYIGYLTQKANNLKDILANAQLNKTQRFEAKLQLQQVQAQLDQAATLARIAKAPGP